LCCVDNGLVDVWIAEAVSDHHQARTPLQVALRAKRRNPPA
jgi:hypothetical protein